MELLHQILKSVVQIAIFVFEYAGVLVLLITGIRGIADYVRHSPWIRLNLAKGMALGLEFKLGSEILRTVVVREFSEILLVGGIVLLRAALTFLIHWEIKNEEKISRTWAGGTRKNSWHAFGREGGSAEAAEEESEAASASEAPTGCQIPENDTSAE